MRKPRLQVGLTVLLIACLAAAKEPIVTGELYNEKYRPQFHFSPKDNWTNDPNGLVYYKGEYHLFFQHNPTGREWGNMTWGHAVSPDLVHWTELDDALGPDRMGTIFSGSAVVDTYNTGGFQRDSEKAIVAFYTAAGGTSPESAGRPFTQCIAFSTDRGRTWTKYGRNPVLPHIVAENRDPKVFWYSPGKHWVMALYLDGTDYALFTSPDLKEWTRTCTISFPGCGECPDLFELPVDGDSNNRKWVFVGGSGNYLIGTFDGKTFTKESGPLQGDYGANYYATQTYNSIPAKDGRRIQITWMTGGNYPDMPFNQQMNFPCELTLRAFSEGIRLCRVPVREIKSLYTKGHTWAGKTLKPGDNLLGGITGELFDIQAQIEVGGAGEFGIKARGEAVSYSVKDKKLSCLGRTADLEPIAGRITIRILVDRASIEVYGNGGKVVMTSCFLPDEKNKSLEIYTSGGPVKVVSLKVYPLRSAWRVAPAGAGVLRKGGKA